LSAGHPRVRRRRTHEPAALAAIPPILGPIAARLQRGSAGALPASRVAGGLEVRLFYRCPSGGTGHAHAPRLQGTAVRRRALQAWPMIYTHVLNREPAAVRSPAARMFNRWGVTRPGGGIGRSAEHARAEATPRAATAQDLEEGGNRQPRRRVGATVRRPQGLPCSAGRPNARYPDIETPEESPEHGLPGVSAVAAMRNCWSYL
jgi:hypothetical protein